ncbi:MAG: nucleoside-diphosphate sugar epimerase/dehydratase, partial [Oscillospiraceae bacterium]
MDTFVLKSGISHLFSAAMIAFSFTGMLLLRFFYRMFRIRQGIRTNPEAKEYVAIIGAGDAGVRLMEEIRHSSTSPYIPYCFVDDSVEKIGKFIHGIEIKGPVSNLEELLKNSPVSNVIVAVPSMLLADKRRILSICSELKYHTQILPEFTQFIEQGNFSAVLREVEIDDLLGREAINFGNKEVADFIYGKIVMVTGGGGSIGSELCRQIAAVSPKQLIIVDIYENNAYAIQQELIYQYKDTLHLSVEIASVRDKKKVDYLFSKYQPQIVIHAAAHKHVPLMENAPEEALKNNVKGTYNVVHAADKYHAEKFILISTDKAVNPTNVMGASKRLCEMILQSMKNVSQTTYVAVRFGNVLGSNGSVIPLFKEQIAHGGPITITDKRIVRYFMTIAEASQLVLQAGAIADSSQIYVLDMGEPVKILELAENLIKLSGYVPYKEIPIVEVGLRPGEKLYEELLMSSEELTDTFHHKIFIEQQQEILPQEMEQK